MNKITRTNLDNLHSEDGHGLTSCASCSNTPDTRQRFWLVHRRRGVV